MICTFFIGLLLFMMSKHQRFYLIALQQVKSNSECAVVEGSAFVTHRDAFEFVFVCLVCMNLNMELIVNVGCKFGLERWRVLRLWT